MSEDEEGEEEPIYDEDGNEHLKRSMTKEGNDSKQIMRNTASAAGPGFYPNTNKRNTNKKQSAIKNYGDIAN